MKFEISPFSFKKASLLSLLLFAAVVLFSQTKTWTGATSTNWATADNWNPSGVPAATDDVIIVRDAAHPRYKEALHWKAHALYNAARQDRRLADYEAAAPIFRHLAENATGSERIGYEWFLLLSLLPDSGADKAEIRGLMERQVPDPYDPAFLEKVKKQLSDE